MILPRTWDVEPSGQFEESLGRLAETHPDAAIGEAIAQAVTDAPLALAHVDFDDPPPSLERRGDSHHYQWPLTAGFVLVVRREVKTVRQKPTSEEIWFCAIERSA